MLLLFPVRLQYYASKAIGNSCWTCITSNQENPPVPIPNDIFIMQLQTNDKLFQIGRRSKSPILVRSNQSSLIDYSQSIVLGLRWHCIHDPHRILNQSSRKAPKSCIHVHDIPVSAMGQWWNQMDLVVS